MLYAAKIRGRASSVSASHTVIAVSSAVPSSACMPVQFQPHALIRAPQLSLMELIEQGCPSAQNCSVPVCGAGSISALHWGGALDQSPSAGQKQTCSVSIEVQKHMCIVLGTCSTQWWDLDYAYAHTFCDKCLIIFPTTLWLNHCRCAWTCQ